MAYRSSKLLALVHQHLMQHGYTKTARELQIENGEKLSTPKVPLVDIYKFWIKNANEKDRKPNNSQSKKLRVQDPNSPSESSEREENGAGLVVAQDKKRSAKKPGKIKTEPVTPKRMNSAEKSTPKVKDTPKIKIKTPVVLAESSDDSDSEEETVPSKAAPLLQETPLRSTPAANRKSETSSTTDSEAPQQKKSAPVKTAAAGKKTRLAANGKAVVKKEDSESSESSDDTDIGKPPVPATPSRLQASKKTPGTPSAVAQPKADPPESSESESEEEPVKVKVPTPAAPRVKAAPPLAKTKAAKGKGKTVTKAADVTPAPKGSTSVRKTPAKTVEHESSEESDSDDELVPSTPKPAAPSSAQASKQKVPLRPTPLKFKAEDSSESSETESEEAPVRKNMPVPEVAASQEKVEPPVNEAVTVSQAKPATRGGNDASADTVVAVMSENGASLGKAQSPTKAEVSETSDNSDSEMEPENQKTPTLPKKGATPATNAKAASAPASKAKVVPAAAEDSENSDSSDSDSEQKAVHLPASNVRTPVPSAKQPVTTSLSPKAKTPLPALADDTSETEDSDSYEGPEAKLLSKSPSPLLASSVKTPSTAAKRPATRSLTPSAAKKAGNLLKAPTPADDSSESGDSDSDDNQAAKKTASSVPASSVKTPSTGAKKPVTLAPDDGSETEDSDSEASFGKVPTPAIASTKVKSVTKSTAVTAASRGSTAAVKTFARVLGDESSEESDSDDEPSSIVEASDPTTGTPSAKPSALTPARVPDSDADSESSDSSDSEVKTKTKVTPLSSTKEKPPASGKVPAAQKPSADTTESSDASDDDLPLAQASKGSLTTRQSAAKRSLQPAVAAKSKARSPADEESSGSSSSSDGKEERAAALKTAVTALAKHKGSTPTPRLTSTPSIASPAKGKAGLPAKSPKAVKTSRTFVSESSDSEDTKQVESPEPAPAKVKKGKSAAAKTPTPSEVEPVKSAGRGRTPAAEESSELSESDSSDEKASKASNSTPIVQTKLEKFFTRQRNAKTTSKLPTESSDTPDGDEEAIVKAIKQELPSTPKMNLEKRLDRTQGSSGLASPKTKVTSQTKTPAGFKQMAAGSSSESSDSEEDLVLKAKAANITAGKSGGKASDVLSKPTAPGKDNSADSDSEPEESQSLLQSPTKSSKKRKRTEGETAVVNESIAKPSKKKSKVQSLPVTKPTPPAPATPGALLESEEETVMALLEGRSPKKAKKSLSKKTAAATVQEKGLPPIKPSEYLPESPSSEDEKHDAKSSEVPDLAPLSAKKEKSGKKRKSVSEEAPSQQKDEKAKKEKKEKKMKSAFIDDEASSPELSKKKKKSDKDKTKPEDKEKKKDKKKETKKQLAQSLISPVVESTDSGVSLQSKPEKKKKVKGDKKIK